LSKLTLTNSVHVDRLLLAHVSTPVVISLDLSSTRKFSARSDAPSLWLQYLFLLALDAWVVVLLHVSLVSGAVASFSLLVASLSSS